MNILFIDSVHDSMQQLLQQAGHQCDLLFNLSKEDTIKILSQYDGVVIRSKFKFTKEVIDQATGIKFIARFGAGMENIDVAYAESKGIKCLHAPEGNRDAVAEHALAMILSLFNNLIRADKQVRSGEWIREGNRGIELMGKTVGIIGYGNMGSAFAQRLKGFGVNVLAYDKYKKDFGDDFVKEVSLEQLQKEADVLSLHLPLTDETLFMVNDVFINQFSKNIFIVNTARGKVLKTDDLVKNIKSGKVLGACLDVLEYEEVSFENMNVSNPTMDYLKNSDRVVLSPHIAGWTHESNAKMAEALAKKILRLSNKP